MGHIAPHRWRVKIARMRRVAFSLLASVLAAVPAFAGAPTAPAAEPPPVTCNSGVPGGVNCISSTSDLKEARSAFQRGIKLEKSKHLDEAFEQFEEAVHLVPDDFQFLRARELVKSQLVFDHTERGNTLMENGQQQSAATEFRAALNLDPDDTFAQERLADALRYSSLPIQRERPLLLDSEEIHLQPKPDLATFRYRGDVRGLFTELATAYGVTVQFDDPLPTKPVRFYLEKVDFFTALDLASRVSGTMWTPLAAHQFLVASDKTDNHHQYDRMSLATFVVPSSVTSPQEASELVLAFRNICDFQKVSSGQSGSFEVHAPQEMIAACSKLLQQLTDSRPQVMLDIQIFQISHNLTRNIGVHIPDTFNLYNIPAGALAALGGQSIQSLINQLISSGGINQAGSSALSGLLAQLQGGQNSIFSQPLATFGNGLTFSGLSIDQLAFNLSVNESWTRELSHMTLQASQGNEASFHIGERYPILNASYAPIYNSPQIAQVLGNQSYVPPFPSVSYEDLGLNFKAKPVVHRDGDVSMSVEMQVRSLTGQSSNGVPVIANREYQGSIRLTDGEPAVVAGEISTSDMRSMSGIPGLGQIPLLNQAMVDNTRTEEDDELLIVITPHVVINPDRNGSEIWVTYRDK
jgi:general secretion pathway protein D